MEIFSSFPNCLVSFLVFLSSMTVFLVISRQWKKSNKRNQKQNLPPGPWRLPFIGSLHHLIGGELPHRTLRSLAERYGPLMYLQLGEIPMIVVSSPSMAKKILKTHDITFADRPQSTSTNIIFYNSKDIAFSQYGDYWRQMRKICMVELLSTKMVKSVSAIRKDELSSLISSIPGNSTPTNMTDKIFRYVTSVICRSAFGNICKDPYEFITTLREVMSLIGGFDVTDVFPSWKLLHKISGVNSRVMIAHEKGDALMQDILNQHIENKAAGIKKNGKFGDEDLIDVLLKLKENAELQFPITDDHIKAVIFDIFLGGTDTSNATIIWAFSEMMKNPNVMAKAQSEVRQVLKGKKTYDDQDFEKLIYLKLVIKETLRLHVPIPLLLPRECREETKIDGFTIPCKTRVLVNAWALGRDPKSWHDPENFIPERFEDCSIDFMGNHFEFVPFGAGRRICPGQQFGLANVGFAIALLLYNFDWKLPYETNPNNLDMTETRGLTASKKEDLYLLATYHKKDEEF